MSPVSSEPEFTAEVDWLAIDAAPDVQVNAAPIVLLAESARCPSTCSGSTRSDTDAGRSFPSRACGRRAAAGRVSAPSSSGTIGITAMSRRSGFSRRAFAEVPPDLLRPQVLVLEVDQPPGVGDGLGVGVRHAALPRRREVVALGQDRRVGAQDLHRLGGRLGRGRRRRRLLGQRARHQRLALGQARQQPARVEGQRRGVLPPLAERRLDVERPPAPRSRRARRARPGAAPNACGIAITCGSPSWAMSSRRLWHRSMPPR